MLIVMHAAATEAQADAVAQAVRAMGLQPHQVPQVQRRAIAVTGNHAADRPAEVFTQLAGVAAAVPLQNPFKLVSRQAKPEGTVIDVDGVAVGGQHTVLMAGPCAVESEAQLMACAHAARAAGAQLLRGGAFKPRTSPYDFQGLKGAGLELLAAAREQTGLKIITEVLSTESLPAVAAVADVLQVGARNMQNFALLQAVGEQRKPVMLKRGLAATVKELLMAAEYIAARGNYNIMLCERGIRTFETMTRNTLDLAAVPLLHELSHLPVIVDPSHGTGRRTLVGPMAQAAIAAGADGVLVEIHPDPDRAWSDGPQSLTLPMFAALGDKLQRLAAAMGRPLAPPAGDA
jgi:3-deoxy-7-phosphoheptulonate synthase